jgi:hypothetical protein
VDGHNQEVFELLVQLDTRLQEHIDDVVGFHWFRELAGSGALIIDIHGGYRIIPDNLLHHGMV